MSVLLRIGPISHKLHVRTSPIFTLLSAAFCQSFSIDNAMCYVLLTFSQQQITSSVIGVSQQPVLDCGTTFHLDYGGRDLPSTPSDNL